MATYSIWYKVHKPGKRGVHRAVHVGADSFQEAVKVLSAEARKRGSIASEFCLERVTK